MSEGLYVHILFICNIIRCKVVFTVDINENTDTKVRVVWVLLVSDQSLVNLKTKSKGFKGMREQVDGHKKVQKK